MNAHDGAQAHRDATGTELDAQARMAPIARKVRDRVLHILGTSERGFTAKEMYPAYVTVYGEPPGGYNSIAPRLPELVRKGYAAKSDMVRDAATAYVITNAGLLHVRQMTKAAA